MTFELELVGQDWLIEQVESMPDHIERHTPVKFNEENRYLPQGVSPRPGFIRYDLFPFLIEIIDCFDPASPVREVNLMKGVQTGYTTALESILLFVIACIKTAPGMFITADKELAAMRVENNIIPMINESGFAELIRSADVGNSKKTGKTKDYLQWEGGGFLVYQGALNAAKMRQTSVPYMLKDELDGWKRNVGQDGDSDSLTDARLSAYWAQRKIFRGSTPLKAPSMIHEAYLRGDQRKYLVCCRSCGFPQELKMEAVNKDTGVLGGFKWDLEDGTLVLESVRYACVNCGHEHYEHDKEWLFSPQNGAHWEPTAKPKEPGIRSYHLPAFYSPYGFRPWYKGVSDFLESYDPETKQTKSIAKLQEYYNNTLGVPFEERGAKIRFESVSAHRRTSYVYGVVPNQYAAEHSGSHILLLTCQVDVHKSNLAVAVMGWTKDMRCYLIDYWRFEATKDEDCTELKCQVWQRLRELIEDKIYTADDGRTYRISITLIDAGYAQDTVSKFCSAYASGVYPILGRDRPSKNQRIQEFAEFTTKGGIVGYRILVDHYKDRIATVLRRDWVEGQSEQAEYHFNAPVDAADVQLKELTREIRKKKTDPQGQVTYVWHRPGNAPNELWDLLGYGHAAVEIIAYATCIQHFELDSIDWDHFWQYIDDENLYLTPPQDGK